MTEEDDAPLRNIFSEYVVCEKQHQSREMAYFVDCAASRLKGMTKITPERLQEAAQRAASRALARMGERMNVAFEEGLLKCTYEGTEEDNAPLHSKTRIVFEWRLLNGQALKSYTLPKTVLHKSLHNGLVPPRALQESLFLACLPTYLQEFPGRGRLPFLGKSGIICCHRIAHPKPVPKYKTATLDVKGVDMELVLSTHTGVGNVHLCASVHFSSKKKRLFVEAPVAEGDYEEHSLKRSNAIVDEAVALGIVEKEIRFAKRESRPLDLDAASSGFSTDFGISQERKKTKQSAFLFWSAKEC